MAERYREPAPPQAAPDLADEEWPDLNGSTANGHGDSHGNSGTSLTLHLALSHCKPILG